MNTNEMVVAKAGSCEVRAPSLAGARAASLPKPEPGHSRQREPMVRKRTKGSCGVLPESGWVGPQSIGKGKQCCIPLKKLLVTL